MFEKPLQTTILVVDDFDEWRLVVRKILQKNPGYKIVGEACDGMGAVDAAAQLQPDVVLMDLGLPLLNGIDAARLIRQRSPSTAIIFLSQNRDAEIRRAALSIGNAYVLKEDAGTVLLPAIQAAVAASADDESG